MRNRGWFAPSAVVIAAVGLLFLLSGAYGGSRGDRIAPETYIMGSGNKVYEPYFDENFNGHFDPGEPFVDMNRNGVWDVNVFVAEGGVVTSKRVMFCYTAVDDSITNGLPRDDNVGKMEFSYFNPFTNTWSRFTNRSYCVLDVPESALMPLSPYGVMYTFKVRAKDPSGNIDPEPAERNFYVGAGYLGTITSVGAETIVDKSAAWSEQALCGLYVNPNIEQTQTFLIVGNTLNKIFVEDGAQLQTIATSGDKFWVIYPIVKPPRLCVTNVATRDPQTRVVVGTGNEVSLAWSEVAPGFEGDVRYDVYRDGQLIASEYTSTTFTDPDNAEPGTPPPVNGRTYTYQVVAHISTFVLGYDTVASNEVKACPIDLTVHSNDILQVTPRDAVIGEDTDEIVFTVENMTKTKPIRWSVYPDIYLYEWNQQMGILIRSYAQYVWSGRFTDAQVVYQKGGQTGAKAQVRLVDSTASWEPGELEGLTVVIGERFDDINGNGVFEWNDDGDGFWEYGEGEKDASGWGQFNSIEYDEFVITSNNRTSLTVDRDPTRIGRNEDGQVENSSGAGSYYYIRDWYAMSAVSLNPVGGEVLMEPETFKLKLDRSRLPLGTFRLYIYVEQNGRDPVVTNTNPLDPIVCTVTVHNGNPLSISRVQGVPYEEPGWGVSAQASTLGIGRDTIALAFNLVDAMTDFRSGFFPSHKSYSFWAPVGSQVQGFGQMFIGCFLNPDVSHLAYWAATGGGAGTRPPNVYRISSYSVEGTGMSAQPTYTLVDLEIPDSSSGHIGVDRRDYPPPEQYGTLGMTARIDYITYAPFGDGSDQSPISNESCWGWTRYVARGSRTRGQWSQTTEVMIRLDSSAVQQGRFGIDTQVTSTAKGDWNDVLDYWWRPLLPNEYTDYYDGTGQGLLSDYFIKVRPGAEVPWKGCKYVIVTGSAEEEEAGGLREECYVVDDSPFVGRAIALDPLQSLTGEHYFITQAYNPEPFYSADWVQQWHDWENGLTDTPPAPPMFQPGSGTSGCECDGTGTVNPGTAFKDVNHNCVYDGYPTLTFLCSDPEISAQSFVIYDSDGDDWETGRPRRWSVTPSSHTILEPRLPGDRTGRDSCNNPDDWNEMTGTYPLLVNGDGEAYFDANGNGIYDSGDVLYMDPNPGGRATRSWHSGYIADDLDSQELYCVIEPGETVTGYLILTNKSVRSALSVSALISEFDPYVTLLSNNLTMYNNVPSGRTLTAVPLGSGVPAEEMQRFAFKFKVSEQVPCYASGYDVTFYTKVFDSWGGVSYDDSFKVKIFRVDPPTVVPPVIDDDRYGYSGTSPYSNGDGVIQAGERIEMPLKLRNESCLPIGNTSLDGQLIVNMRVDNPFVSIVQPQKNYLYILPGEEGTPYDPVPEFEMEVDPNYDGSALPFELTISAQVTYGSAPPPAEEYVHPCRFVWRRSFCENPKIYGIEHYNKLSGKSTALLTSTLIDENALFVPGSLVGLMLNPNTNQSKTFEIISNTVTSIYVDGDLLTVAKVGDPYEVVRDASNIVLSPGETVEVVMRAAPGMIGSFNFEDATRERGSGTVSGVTGDRFSDLTASYLVGSLAGLRVKITSADGIFEKGIFQIVGNSRDTIVVDRNIAGIVSVGDSYTIFGSATLRRFFESNVRMFDDGKHKDGAAGDGVYVGTYTVQEGDNLLLDVVGYLEDPSSGNTGHVYASKPLMIDTGPPAAPANVVATSSMVALGIGVKLTWDINKEFDFMYCYNAGYDVFRTEDPSQIPRDPLNFATLTWASSSTIHYVGPPEAFTDTNGNGRWDPGEPYKDWNGNQRYDSGPFFVDTSAIPGVTYYYYIKAIDAYGNSSEYSRVVAFTLYTPGTLGVDEMPDEWEERYGLKAPMAPDTYNGSLDFDNDGLTNYEEFLLHTNPCDPDTDKNGECDGSEYDRSNIEVSPIDPNDESLSYDVRPGGYAGISTSLKKLPQGRFEFVDEHANWVVHAYQGAYLYAGNNSRFEVVDNTQTSLIALGDPDEYGIVVPDYYWIDGAKNVRPDTAIEAKVTSVYGIDPRSIVMYLNGTEVPNEELLIAPCYAKPYGEFAKDELAECWVVDTLNDSILELGGSSEPMREIGRVYGEGFNRPEGFALDPTTETLWVADTGNNEVVKLKMLSALSGTWTSVFASPNGTTLTDMNASWRAGALVGYTVYPNITMPGIGGYTITSNTQTSLTVSEDVSMFAGAGDQYVIDFYEAQEQCRITGFNNPTCVAVDWVKGTCWVADTGNDRVVRLAGNIDEYGAVYDLDVSVGYHTTIGGPDVPNSPLIAPRWVSVNSYPFPPSEEGTCWVADTGHGDLVKISPGGTAILKRVHGFNEPSCIALAYYPGPIWVADTGNDRVVRLEADVPDGYDVNARNYPEKDTKIQFESGSVPTGVAVNQVTGTAWAALFGTGQVVRIADDGSVEATISGFESPTKVSVASYRNLAGESGLCWVADSAGDRVYRIDPEIPDGYNLLTDTGYLTRTATGAVQMPMLVWANSGGQQAGYMVKYQPKQAFGFGQVVDVQIEATDLFLTGKGDGGGNHKIGSYSFTTVQRDTSAPFLANLSPPKNSRNASVNGPITLEVLDRGTGVNRDSIVFSVNGQVIIRGTQESTTYVTLDETYNSEEMASGYAIAYYPEVPFGYNSKVDVEVLAADFAFPEANESRLTYSFTTEVDREPPMVYEGSEQPRRDQAGVDPKISTVSVIIFDLKSGVDVNSIQVTVQDKPVDWSKMQFVEWSDGVRKGYRVMAPIGRALEYDTDVTVCIRAADLGGDSITGPNWMDWYCWSFTTRTDVDPPYFVNARPYDGQSRVPVDTSVYIEVKDNEEGVDPSSIKMVVDEEEIPTANLSMVPISDGFQVTYTPMTLFRPNKVVDVEVYADDLAAPPNSGFTAYRFTLVDEEAPVARPETLEPRPGSKDVRVDTIISLVVEDVPDPSRGIEFNSGIDEDSVEMYVMGQRVTPTVKWIMTPFTAQIWYRADLDHCREIPVRVLCSDLEGNAMNPVEWSFETTGCYPNISVPESVSFDRTAIGAAADTKTLTIENTGWQPLTISDVEVTIGSKHFSADVPELPFNILAQQSYDLTMHFAPQKYGACEGQVKITSNDPETKQVFVSLVGDAGYPPVVTGGSMAYSDISSERGGKFIAIAEVSDPDGQADIDRVEASVEGEYWGDLHDDGTGGDMIAGDGVYCFQRRVEPGSMSPGQYLVLLQAVDKLGYRSTPWPYLEIRKHERFLPDITFSSPYQMELLVLDEEASGRAHTFGLGKEVALEGRKGPIFGSGRPLILSAGYLDWNYTFLHTDGGDFTVYAWVYDADGGCEDIETVELMYEGGQKLLGGLYLTNEDWGISWATPCHYFLRFNDIHTSLPEGLYLLEIVATDKYGRTSEVWPYLHVK